MHDVIIVGAGPAGLTAALYAGRFKLDTVVLEKMMPGGQILMTPTIYNYPGFSEGIATDELINNMKKQIEYVGVPILSREATDIAVDRGQHHNTYTVFTPEGPEKCRALIVATGASWKKLGVPGEEKLVGRGVSYCATCDAPLFRNREVVVVGGGDKAIEEAVYLTQYAAKVSLVHRRQGFRAAEVLVEKARKNPKIEFLLDTTVDGVKGENKVEGVVLHDLKTNALRDLPCAGVFIFVGISPNTAFVKKDVETDENGFIITDDSMKTSLHGVYACGDCRLKTLYQVVNGCGEAAVACHSAHTYLLNK